MSGGSLFTLFDDLALLLDDVAAMTKVATKKTAGVLGDDLALNAEQVAGVSTDREWPVIWAVAKRSLVNKCALVPAALLISALTPFLVQPLLMIGGAFLCFEGAEKLLAWRTPHVLALAPRLMKGLSVVGTVAMFLVGGGIVGHGVGPIRDWLDPMSDLAAMPIEGAIGLVVGAVLAGVQGVVGKARGALALRSSRPSAP